MDEATYSYLSEEILAELLREKVNHPEAGAGCVFDNLSSPNYQSELIGLKIIIKVLKEYRL